MMARFIEKAIKNKDDSQKPKFPENKKKIILFINVS
jgi:hypothetical protein